MTNTILGDQILKRDSLGRVRTPVERRDALLDEFERSGMSGTKFAGFIGVKYQTLASWIQKRRREGKRAQARRSGAGQPLPDCALKLQWVEAVVEKETSSAAVGGLQVHLPGGARMEITDVRQAALAAELLRGLTSQRPLPC